MAADRRRLTPQQRERRDQIIGGVHLSVMLRMGRRRKRQRLITIGRRWW